MSDKANKNEFINNMLNDNINSSSLNKKNVKRKAELSHQNKKPKLNKKIGTDMKSKQGQYKNVHTKSNSRVKNRKKKSAKSSKKQTVSNRYGVLPMSCTLDIGTIGKLDSIKQVLGLHNRDEVVDKLINMGLNKLLKNKQNKDDYKLYNKVFMMKHRKSAEKHYKQFYQNGRK